LESLRKPAEGGRLTRDELLAKLAGLRQARVAAVADAIAEFVPTPVP
jgi:hypothetical protein